MTMFRGLNPAAQAPQGLQMNWQPNIGSEGQSDSGQAMAGLGSAADMLQQWLANRRKGIALKQASQITDVPMQAPQNMA